jgi:O-antigen/teichoic acid export membrane protein
MIRAMTDQLDFDPGAALEDAGSPGTAGLEWREVGRRGARGALQLAVRGLLLRILTFLGTLALARILAPSDFGVFAIVSFVVSVWAMLGDFGLGAALVQQREEPSARQLATAWTAQQAIALTAMAAIWLTAPALTALVPGLPGDAPWMLRVLSLGLLLSSLRTLPTVMMERELRFGPLAAAEIAQQAAYYAVAIGLAVAGWGAWSFVLAGVAQLGTGALVVNLVWRRRPTLALDRDCLGRLLAFGFDFQLSVILATLRDSPLPAMAGLVLGTASAGFLQFASRIGLTVASVDEIVARIAFPALSRLQGRADDQARALGAATMLTALFMVPFQCLLAALAPILVPLVFGDRWQPAVLPLQLICVGTLFRFPARYVRQTVFAEGDSRRGLWIAVACLVLAIVPVAPGLVIGGLAGVGLGFLVGALLGLVATAWLARRYVRLDWRPFGRLVGIGLAAGGLALTAAQTLSDGLPAGVYGETAGLGLGTVVFLMIFGGLAWLTDSMLLGQGLRLARRAFDR